MPTYDATSWATLWCKRTTTKRCSQYRARAFDEAKAKRPPRSPNDKASEPQPSSKGSKSPSLHAGGCISYNTVLYCTKLYFFSISSTPSLCWLQVAQQKTKGKLCTTTSSGCNRHWDQYSGACTVPHSVRLPVSPSRG